MIYVLINAIFSAVIALLELLPSSNATIPEGINNGIESLVAGMSYLLPLNDLLNILMLSVSINIFKFVFAVIIRTKSFIPTMGA